MDGAAFETIASFNDYPEGGAVATLERFRSAVLCNAH